MFTKFLASDVYLILAYFPYFGKIKVGLYYHHAVCLFVCVPLFNFWMPEPIFMKPGMCILAPVHLNDVLHKSVVFYAVRVVSKESLWVCGSIYIHRPSGAMKAPRAVTQQNIEPRGTGDQKSLRWQGPAEIYWTGLFIPL
jgi:hypothetical protein